MKISVVITTLCVGGAEMMLYRLLSVLKDKIEFHVISMTDVSNVGEKIAELGIKVTGLGMKPGHVSIVSFVKLVKILKEDQPDIVHTWMYHADFFGGMAAKVANVKNIVWCIRNSTLDAVKTKVSTWVIVRLCAMLSKQIPLKIVSCSKSAAELHMSMGYSREKFKVLYNGIDTQLFNVSPENRLVVRNELRIPLDSKVIGLFGRYDPQKDHECFIKAAGLLSLCSENGNVHYLLAGEKVDEENNKINDLVRSLNLGAVVHLIGLKKNIHRYFPTLDIITSSSAYGEAFPNSIAEGMSCGIPAVVTDVGDSKEIVGDTGIVVPVRSPDALANAWGEILCLTDERYAALGQSARERIQKNFELSAIGNQYFEFYQTLVNR